MAGPGEGISGSDEDTWARRRNIEIPGPGVGIPGLGDGIQEQNTWSRRGNNWS